MNILWTRYKQGTCPKSRVLGPKLKNHRYRLDMEESELQPIVRGWVERSASRGLRLFVFGKTGVGKSSLINTLLGKEIAKEGEEIYSQTRTVTSYTEQRSIKTVQETIEGVTVTMWDSPGLKDPQTDEGQTLKDIKENCNDIDIFVYCTSLTQTRIGQDEYDSIMNLTNVLGDGIWRRGLIALTFANEVRLPPSSCHDTLEGYLKKRVSDWREALRNAVKKAGVNSKDAEALPVVPTSYRDLPLPATTGGANWFSVFWTKCIDRIRLGSLPALLRVKRGPLLECPETSYAVQARLIADRLARIGDELEEEYIHTMIDRLLKSERLGPALLSSILITTVQTMNITDQQFYREFWMRRSIIIPGILVLSLFAIIVAAVNRKL